MISVLKINELIIDQIVNSKSFLFINRCEKNTSTKQSLFIMSVNNVGSAIKNVKNISFLLILGTSAIPYIVFCIWQ